MTTRRRRRKESRRRRRRARRTWLQRLVLLFGGVVTLSLVVSALGLLYLFRTVEQIPRAQLAATGVLAAPAAPGEPTNYLIVGTDDAAGLPPGDPARIGRDGLSERSDTIMVLRLDPESRDAALLSLPRDLWVPIAGTGTNQRINTALQVGGPEMLIRTIDEYLGIPIQHFIQVDFGSFQQLVEVVGGVPMALPYPARDRMSGLNVPAGQVTLDPDQALAFVRSRFHEQRIDGEWVTDPTGDLGRVERQQEFVRAALRAAVDHGGRNLARLDQLLSLGLDAIVVDDALTADDILRLGNRFRTFEADRLEMHVVPTVDDVVGQAQVLRLAEDEADAVLALFRGGSVDELSPQSVRLQVLNGSGAPGEAARVAEELAAVGFGLAGLGDAVAFDSPRTVVQHPPDQRDAADLVARWLVAGAELEEDEGGDGIVVVTGTDWRGVRSQPVPPDPEEPSDGVLADRPERSGRFDRPDGLDGSPAR